MRKQPMSTNEKEMLDFIAKETMFQLTTQETEELATEYHLFLKHVEAIDQIDTTNIEPMSYPYDIVTTYLRDDKTVHTITREEALLNVKEVKENQIKVPKVVK